MPDYDLSTLERLLSAHHPAPDPRDVCQIDPPGPDDSFAACTFCGCPADRICVHDYDVDYPYWPEVRDA